MNIPPQIGKYKILQKLGQGASGCVLKAEQQVIHRVVAMKVLFTHLLQAKPLIIKRFKREARLASSLLHPNIVPIFEIGEADGMYYYTMQHIEGRGMLDYVKDDSISLRNKLDISTELCNALALAHRRNIIHRDLKPHNVIISKDLHPVILDFGIAKSLIDGEQMTQAGHILGSAHYMAPEQAGPGEVGTYSDIFALGVMMYELVTGKRPFEGSNVTELIYQRLQYRQNPEAFRPPLMREIKPDVPELFDRIVFRCLDAVPEKRYQDADALLNDLQKFRGELLFVKVLQEQKQNNNQSVALINKKKSYIYPAIIAILIFAIFVIFSLLFARIEAGHSPWVAILKSLQQNYIQVIKILMH